MKIYRLILKCLIELPKVMVFRALHIKANLKSSY
jgi:hypothetical protein